MSSPYTIETTEPVVVKFSGGRSSGMMLLEMLKHNDIAPTVIFNNTSAEHPATYEFIERIAEEIKPIQIKVLEYTTHAPYYKQVKLADCDRTGQLFRDMIEYENMFPNAFNRLCTYKLKVRPSVRFLKDITNGDYHAAIGFRTGEENRAYNSRQKAPETETPVFPLIRAGIDKQAVEAYWRKMPFNFALDGLYSNCVYCPLKGIKRILKMRAEEPRADGGGIADGGPATLTWWRKTEALAEGHIKRPGLGFFPKGRMLAKTGERLTYKALAEFKPAPNDKRQPLPEAQLDLTDDAPLPCECTD